MLDGIRYQTKHRFIHNEPMADLLRDTMKEHTQAGVSTCARIMSEDTVSHHGYERWSAAMTTSTDICKHIDNIPNETDPGKCLPAAFRQNIPELDRLQSDVCENFRLISASIQ